jgi:hypothetical protein
MRGTEGDLVHKYLFSEKEEMYEQQNFLSRVRN